jgi:hypothetical protein
MNLSQYANDITLFENQFLVETESERRAHQELMNPNFRLHLLVGNSGVGKSTVALALLKKHCTSGKPGLWISAELLDRASSLTPALETTLKSQIPTLRSGTGLNVFSQLSDDEPLLLVFDDKNRSSSPMIATGAPDSASCRVKLRPQRIGIFIVWKYPGDT